jgi:hypothetical protein
MPDHNCPHNAEFLRIIKIIDGNGKDGLVLEVDRLKNEQTDMIQEVSTIARAMSEFVEEDKKRNAIRADREKNKAARSSAIQRVGTISAIIFGAVGLLYVILDHIGP